MDNQQAKCDPEIYRGFEVYKSNRINLSLDEWEYKRLIDSYHNAGGDISFAKIIALQGRPCQQCGCDALLIPVKKGILSTAKQSSGASKKPSHD